MKVSIVTTNYNYARFLPAAVNSVLAQTYQNLEMVIVDDGSTDNSREVITQLQQQCPDKIKAVFQLNQGQAAASNTGFAAATGEIVAFLDADDLWKPQKLQKIAEIFQTRSDVVGVMHYLDFIDIDGNFVDAMRGPRLSENLAQLIIETGNAWYFPPTSSLAFRRNALEKVFPIDPVKWRYSMDHSLIYCTAFFGKFKMLYEELGSYRYHGANNHSKDLSSREQREKMLALTESTNRSINEFIQRIGYPAKVDLSRNLQYRREKYYMRGKLSPREVLAISHLILEWKYYSLQEKALYLGRFLLKNTTFLFRSASHVDDSVA